MKRPGRIRAQLMSLVVVVVVVVVIMVGDGHDVILMMMMTTNDGGFSPGRGKGKLQYRGHRASRCHR